MSTDQETWPPRNTWGNTNYFVDLVFSEAATDPCNSNADTNAHSDADTDPDSNPDPDTNPNTNTDTNPDTDTDTNADSDEPLRLQRFRCARIPWTADRLKSGSGSAPRCRSRLWV